MTLIDVIAGRFLPSLFGWIFLVFVIVSEGLLLSKYLTKKWRNDKIYQSVCISNLITTAIGYCLLDHEKIGGHLLNWVPVDYYRGNVELGRTIFIFILSFIGSVLIEALCNMIMLKNLKSNKEIFKGTFWVNAFTYTVGAIVIFIYNFCYPL
jgi:hypothetical protein